MNAISPALASSVSLANASDETTLLQMGILLERLIAREKEAWDKVPENAPEGGAEMTIASSKGKDTAALARAIAMHRANSFSGLLVKARAAESFIGADHPASLDALIVPLDPVAHRNYQDQHPERFAHNAAQRKECISMNALTQHHLLADTSLSSSVHPDAELIAICNAHQAKIDDVNTSADIDGGPADQAYIASQRAISAATPDDHGRRPRHRPSRQGRGP